MTEYAIVRTQGKEYRVSPGQTLLVDRMAKEPGEKVELKEVLLVRQDDTIEVGSPTVPGVHVEATVLGHERGRKIVVFKYKPKTRYRRKQGHRQELTRLVIHGIVKEGTPETEAAPSTRTRARRTRRERDGA